MSQKGNGKKFKVNNDSAINPQNKRDEIKTKIIEKYGISSEEAEKILSKIERIDLEKKHEKQNMEKNQQKDEFAANPQIFKNNDDEKTDDNEITRNEEYSEKNSIELNSNNSEHINEEPMENKNSKNVDSILEDIIPNYNQQISIKLDHVDLTFEVSNEKVDTLKENFIRTLRREKSRKIKIHALKDISFQSYKGEKVGIIGYNGAGKSTLLNVITGIYPPDKGTVTTQGNISPLLSLGAGFDFNFSGRKNIILNGAVLGYDKKFLESKMDEIIEFSELGKYIDIPIKNYSSGMIAKLGFSIATAVNPDILIIDEILGVGDVNFSKKSRDKIRSLMDGGTTVLLVSHSIPQIREICDKAIWIDNGTLRDMGEVNKVCDAYLKDAEKASKEQVANIELVKK